jgi:hypothetical protein
METKNNPLSLKAILIIIGIGIWVNVMQNAGIIPTKQNVIVKGGFIDADINGKVDIRGTVSVDNEVEVDIKKINGWRAANYYEYTYDGKEFHSLGIN